MKCPLLIFTAAKGIGKTTRLQQLASIAGGKFGGILSPVIDKKRYFLHPPSGKSWPMEATGKEERLEVGRFSFSLQAFLKAKAQVMEDLENPEIRAVVVDEIGPLELRGLGFANVMERLLAAGHRSKQICLVVREGMHEEVMEHFHLPWEKTCIVYDPKHLHWENGYFCMIKD